MFEPRPGDHFLDGLQDVTSGAGALLGRPLLWLGLGLIAVAPSLLQVFTSPLDWGALVAAASDEGPPTPRLNWSMHGFPPHPGIQFELAGKTISEGKPSLQFLTGTLSKLFANVGLVVGGLLFEALALMATALLIRASLAGDDSGSLASSRAMLGDPPALLRYVAVSVVGAWALTLPFFGAILLGFWFAGLLACVYLFLGTRLLLVDTLIAGGFPIGAAFRDSWTSTRGRVGRMIGLVVGLAVLGAAWAIPGMAAIRSLVPLHWWPAVVILSGVPMVVVSRLALASATRSLVPGARLATP